MKIPCELVVWYVLPTIRREVAKELVKTHGMSQAQVAKKFGRISSSRNPLSMNCS